jgi:hypothetical protein
MGTACYVKGSGIILEELEKHHLLHMHYQIRLKYPTLENNKSQEQFLPKNRIYYMK